jgi:hypothetical protein
LNKLFTLKSTWCSSVH